MIRLIILLLSFAVPLLGAAESPLDYLIDSLRLKNNQGTVESSNSKLAWPTIIDSEPTAITPWHGNFAIVTVKLPADQFQKFVEENGFKRNKKPEEEWKEVPLLKRLLEKTGPSYSVWLELPRLGAVDVTIFQEADAAGATKLELLITQYTAYFVRPQIEAAPATPATRPEYKSEGNQK